MHKLTEIEVDEKRKQYAKERNGEWNRIVRSAAASGSLMSGSTIIHYLETGFRYIDIVLNAAYSVETGALLKSGKLQPDDYFMRLKDRLFQIAEDESGIVRSKALAQFRNMGDSIRTTIISEAGQRTADLRASILNHTERIKEQMKLEFPQGANIALKQQVSHNDNNESPSNNSIWSMLHPKIRGTYGVRSLVLTLLSRIMTEWQ